MNNTFKLVFSNKVILTISHDILYEYRSNLSHWFMQNGIVQTKSGLSSNPIIEDHVFISEGENTFELSRGLGKKFLEMFYKNQEQYFSNVNLVIEEDYLSHNSVELESNIKELRDYQQEVANQLKTHNSGYLVIPTGGGKTVVMINEIVQKKAKTLVIVHTTYLLEQFKERLLGFTNIKEEDIGIIGKGKKNYKPVSLCLMQTFGKYSAEELQEITKEYDLVMIDEAHHLTAATLKHISENVKSKYFYGLTATPDKSEGSAREFLELLIGPLLYHITEEVLEEKGVILKPYLGLINYKKTVLDMYRERWKIEEFDNPVIRLSDLDIALNEIPDGVDLYNLKSDTYYICNNFLKTGGEKVLEERNIPYIKVNKQIWKSSALFAFGPGKLLLIQPDENIDMSKLKKKIYSDISRINKINEVITHELSQVEKKYILVLSDEVDHLTEMYNRCPFKERAVLLHGKLPKKEQIEIDEKINSKDVQIIYATSKLIGEGWDKTWLNVLINTQLLKDHELLKQLVGRVIRQSEGKNTAIVYDIIDSGCPVTWAQFKKRYLNYYQLRTYQNYKIDWYNKIIEIKSF